MSRPGRGRPPSEPDDPRSLEERQKQKRVKDAERQQRKRGRDKEEKIATGTYAATRSSEKGASGAADNLWFVGHTVAISERSSSPARDPA